MRTKPIDEVIAQQVRFSSRAFGPGPRTEGLLQHIRKEMVEINEDPKDLLEWIDVVILGLDGAWRCAATQHPWLHETDLGKFVADALLYKIGVNMERDWPDWREAGQDQPIEHVRKDGDPGVVAAEEKRKESYREHLQAMGHRHVQDGAPGTSNHNHLHLGRPSQGCPRCQGSGQRVFPGPCGDATETCAFCRGRGRVENRRT